MKSVDEWLIIYKEIWNRYKGNLVRLTLGQFQEDNQWAYIEVIEISIRNYSEIRLYEDYPKEVTVK